MNFQVTFGECNLVLDDKNAAKDNNYSIIPPTTSAGLADPSRFLALSN